MYINKKNAVMKDFILSHFSYDGLVRMTADIFKINNALLTCTMEETFPRKYLPILLSTISLLIVGIT